MSKKTAIKIRKGILVVWFVLMVVLLVAVRYAVVHAEAQPLITKLANAYLWSAPVVIGITVWLGNKR
jgi:hypothetical protein